ncbi:hypothetical protein ACWDZW_28320, partial [Streptomyces coeruleorubidus]
AKSKKKSASWLFLQWATGKEHLRRGGGTVAVPHPSTPSPVAQDHGPSSPVITLRMQHRSHVARPLTRGGPASGGMGMSPTAGEQQEQGRDSWG